MTLVTADPLGVYLEAAINGDDRALAALVQETQPMVWRLCAALGSPGEEEDLVQESYLRIIKSLGSFRGDSPVLPWMLQIARHVCADQVRRRVRQRRLAERVRAQLSLDGPLAAPDQSLDGLVRVLEPSRREAFVLTQVLGFSYEDAATILACPVGTIRSRVARARADLVAMVRDADAI